MTEADLRQIMAVRENENIEFKEGVLGRKEIGEYAVALGNMGGGKLIFGITDQIPRQIVGVQLPTDVEAERIRASVADYTGIHVQLEGISTPEGNVLVVHIPPRPRGLPFHTKDGKYLVRVADSVRGMSIQELDDIRREAGAELTSRPVLGPLERLIRPAGVEALRELMREAQAPPDLISLSDPDLLRSLGVILEDGTIQLAGVLLVGNSDVLQDQLPYARWQFRRMTSDTDYDQRADGDDCITIALKRLREFVESNNPIVTLTGSFVQPELPRYPTIALRELFVNALVHRDYEKPGSVSLKLYPDKLELANPGSLPDGVTARNILHHPSVARYPTLMGILTRMRLANEANLGLPRVYRELLQEGKEPPIYDAKAAYVRVVVPGKDARREFLELVQQNPQITVDQLLVVHYLENNPDINVPRAAIEMQRTPDEAAGVLNRMVTERILSKKSRSEKGAFQLSERTYAVLASVLSYRLDERVSDEEARSRILAALESGPLKNEEMRSITKLGRYQVVRLMKALQGEGRVRLEGKGKAQRWVLVGPI